MLLEAEQGADHHSTRGDICLQTHLEQQDWKHVWKEKFFDSLDGNSYTEMNF